MGAAIDSSKFINKYSDRAVGFINNLTHTHDPWSGKSFNLRQWQIDDIIVPLFGNVDEDGLRIYTECLVYMARKNGKSELGAALALLMLMDGKLGNEVIGAASSRKEASYIFNIAAQMVRNDPWLRKYLKIIDSQKRIVYPKTNSVYRVIPADAKRQWTMNPTCIIYDEIHSAPNRELYDALATSMGAREQPLFIMFTTAGHDIDSIGYEVYKDACDIRDGIVIDPTFLPVIYEVPKDADWTDPEQWMKANPALGDFKYMKGMIKECAKAKRNINYQNAFRRLQCNQWTEQAERWLDMDQWFKCKKVKIREKGLRKVRCFPSLDLASVRDLNCLMLYFPEYHHYFLPFFWVPEGHPEVLKKYKGWIAEGLIETTPGNSTDYKWIRHRIGKLAKQYKFEKLALDPWNSSHLGTELEEDDGIPVIEFRQGFKSMNEPCKMLEKMVIDGTLCHNDHKVLRWNAGNVAVDTDPTEAIKINKKRSKEKVDGMVAAAMCIGRYMFGGEAPSAYDEDHGFNVI